MAVLTRPTDAPKTSNRSDALLKRELTPRTSAMAGPATPIPWLFYFIALNVIVAHEARSPGRVLEVLIYNLIWFALPIAAPVLCIVAPDTARGAVGAVETWTKGHTRTIILVVSLGAGASLVIRGALSV